MSLHFPQGTHITSFCKHDPCLETQVYDKTGVVNIALAEGSRKGVFTATACGWMRRFLSAGRSSTPAISRLSYLEGMPREENQLSRNPSSEQGYVADLMFIQVRWSPTA